MTPAEIADLIQRALASDNHELMALALRLTHPFYTFQPHADSDALQHYQSSYVNDTFDGIKCVLGGNGSGKGWTTSHCVAKFLIDTPPPEKNTPFWIMSTDMTTTTSNCWRQGLSQWLPDEAIAKISWFNCAQELPNSIMLRPHANGNNYVIEFRSYDQKRERLQGRNIVGFWLDEQVPSSEVFMEVLARTRKWVYPNSKFYSLTPLSPDPWLENIYLKQDQYPSWRFYRFSTLGNPDINPDYAKQIRENELDALVETRLFGSFCRFEGAIYKDFSLKTHVISPFPIPANWLRLRGLDFGWSHPTTCVYAARDPNTGAYYVYREYYQSKASIEDHVREINEGWDYNSLYYGRTYGDYSAAQDMEEFRRRGVRNLVPAAKAVKEGIATVQTLLRTDDKLGTPRLFIFDTCEMLTTQLKNYVWDDRLQDRPRKANDDGPDALRYLLYSHRKETMQDWSPPKLAKPANRSPI